MNVHYKLTASQPGMPRTGHPSMQTDNQETIYWTSKDISRDKMLQLLSIPVMQHINKMFLTSLHNQQLSTQFFVNQSVTLDWVMFLKREPMGIMSKTDELPVAQPTVSNHSREFNTTMPPKTNHQQASFLLLILQLIPLGVRVGKPQLLCELSLSHVQQCNVLQTKSSLIMQRLSNWAYIFTKSSGHVQHPRQILCVSTVHTGLLWRLHTADNISLSHCHTTNYHYQ